MYCDKIIIDGSNLVVEFSFFEGEIEIGIPDYDFEIEFYCYPESKYVASKKGDVLTNCFIDGKKLVVCIDDKNFGEGTLHERVIMYVPDIRFDDGTRKQISLTPLCIVRTGITSCTPIPINLDEFKETIPAESVRSVFGDSDYSICLEDGETLIEL